jgi:hypothetical protein
MTELEFLAIFGNSRRAKMYVNSLSENDNIGAKLVALFGLGIIECTVENKSFAEFMDRVEEDTTNVVPFRKGNR